MLFPTPCPSHPQSRHSKEYRPSECCYDDWPCICDSTWFALWELLAFRETCLPDMRPPPPNPFKPNLQPDQNRNVDPDVNSETPPLSSQLNMLFVIIIIIVVVHRQKVLISRRFLFVLDFPSLASNCQLQTGQIFSPLYRSLERRQ